MKKPSRRTATTVSATALGALILGAGAGWATATVLAPPPDVLEEITYTYASAVEGEVGQTLQLNSAATWESSPVGVNASAGTITSVALTNSQTVAQNAELYAVDLRPVHVAAGNTPSFRDLSLGSEGDDVSQLQQMLRDTGFMAARADAKFSSSTETAVKRWQKAMRMPVDGIVRAGDLIFVPTLPSRLSLDSAVIHNGARISGGEFVVSALPDAPKFSVTATTSQSAAIPDTAAVSISPPDGQAPWTASVSKRETNADGQVVLSLESSSDSAICADACDSLRTDEPSYLPSTIVIVPQQQGITIPSAAIRTDATGQAVVINRDGTTSEITVLSGVNGISLIDGVNAGTDVRVPAEER
jgi:peptidoglycan hydrolase-like protein with peptidoglycan-binding domain